MLLYPGSDLCDGAAGLVLRRRNGDGTQRDTALMGQACPGRVVSRHTSGVVTPVVTSVVDGLVCRVGFAAGVASPSFYWHLRIDNIGDVDQRFDLVWRQDAALTPYPVVRINEYYVSQYLDLTPVDLGATGVGVGVRQNMPGATQPWALLGSLGTAEHYSTDLRQATDGDLPSRRLQHEHAVVGLQHRTVVLGPGETLTTGFFATVLLDHPDATSEADAAHAATALADPAARPPAADAWPSPDEGEQVHPALFHRAPMLVTDDPTPEVEAALAGPAEPGRHLVTAAKERAVLRPHGHILRSGSALVPDEDAVTATCWMAGGFLTQLTQGHVSREPILSTRRGYVGGHPSAGLRVFVAEEGAGWQLLDVPSAWRIEANRCTWIYRSGDLTLAVSAETPEHEHVAQVRLRASRPVRVLAAAHLACFGDDGAEPATVAVQQVPGGVRVPTGAGAFDLIAAPEAVVGDDGALFHDGCSRGQPWLTFTVEPVEEWSLTVRPALTPTDGADRPAGPVEPGLWDELAGAVRLTPSTDGDDGVGDGVGRDLADVADLADIAGAMPWFGHDAVIHYLSPRGLEQFTGGGWGTRDVCQGPVGLLLALGRHTELRELVLRVMAAQNARGDWPQAFDFYPRYVHWAQQDSHGDVVHWPLLALADYLLATGDASVLAERVPFVGDGGPVDDLPVLDHVRRALDAIDAGRIPGTALPAYGHGDWNDSLQPADRALAAGLCSTWTVTLQAQALGGLAAGLRTCASGKAGEVAGQVAPMADRAAGIADAGTVAMRDLLMPDGVLAGYGRFDAGPAPVEHLVHPRDRRTGLRYSILPMIHAIAADLLTPDEAARHLELIATHLRGPDGGRLFDRPVGYAGGPMRVFQRAEASTFFGREIGIMYTHAHLRYAQALARVGDADGLLRALALATPTGLTRLAPSARPRQSTTYFSSSDAAFADRYAAAAGYQGVLDGTVDLEGGWRVYSSGPGLFLRLVVEELCGIRVRGDRLEIDPVLPVGLDGLGVRVPLPGGALRLRYRVGGRRDGPPTVRQCGRVLPSAPLTNRYRHPGVSIARADLVPDVDLVVTLP